MRFVKYFIALLLNLFCYVRSDAQNIGRGDFYDSVKYYDFSKLWHSDSVLNLTYVDDTFYSDPKYFAFPEPLGFIGDNYQRFYIHFITVQKSKKNPYQYAVTGKTKVKNNICAFQGTITIDTACLNPDTTELVPGVSKKGRIICSCAFKERKNCKNSGVITGSLTTDWCLYKGAICYDNITGVADGYSNNGFNGKWKSYTGSIVKKCNWGDDRIPNCGDLDIGAGEFSPNNKYLNNGWQSYRDWFNETDEEKKAKAIENTKWWR